jgi:predicted nucleotidyltransferase
VRTPSGQPVAEPIRALVARIRDRYAPLQIWLFGSRARGDARADSDWDLLAVVDDQTPEALFDPEAVWRLLDLRSVAADVIVMPRAAFVEDADTPNTLAWPVSREGVLPYER